MVYGSCGLPGANDIREKQLIFGTSRGTPSTDQTIRVHWPFTAVLGLHWSLEWYLVPFWHCPDSFVRLGFCENMKNQQFYFQIINVFHSYFSAMKHNFVTSYGLLLGVLCVYYVRIVLFFHFILSRHIFGRNVPTFWGMNIEHVNFGHFSAHLTMTPILMKFWCFSTRKYSLNTARALCESIRTTRSAATLLGFKSFRTFWPSIFGRFLTFFHRTRSLCSDRPEGSFMAYLKGFKLHFVNLSVSAHFGSFRRLNLLVVVTQARGRGTMSKFWPWELKKIYLPSQFNLKSEETLQKDY